MDNLPPEISIDQIETRKVLKQLSTARAALAELKGIAATIPNEQILIDTLSLQEAKDSSEVENIITTHDELYQSNYSNLDFTDSAAKEVYSYAVALKHGYKIVKGKRIIQLKLLIEIQQIIENNDAGIRKLPGTVLKNESNGEIIYTPPQSYDEVLNLLSNLEKYINDEIGHELDPLVKMAIIHYQFESIHPFYDGNGRTGRILNILYLIKEDLLNLPVLYLSRYIIRHRPVYYKLLQNTREKDDWETWVLFMLKAVEQTSQNTIQMVKEIKALMQKVKLEVRNSEPNIYSQDLINNIFKHPYTRIQYLKSELGVSRQTATKYLERLVELKLLRKRKIGRSNYYVNEDLFEILTKPGKLSNSN